jgi:hypothetical protein
MLKDISAKSAQKRKNRKRNRDGKIKKATNSTSALNRGGLWGLSSTASSYEVSLSNPTSFEFVKGGGVTHREWGGATRIKGRQELCLVSTTASNSNLLVSGNATGTANSIGLLPYSLGDRVAYIAAVFQRYAFRKLRFIYVTRVATTQVGCFAMAYITDGGNPYLASGDGSYSSIQSIDPCRIVPFRKEYDCLEMSYTGERTWFTDPGNATVEGERQTYQGTLWAYPDAPSIGAVNQGELYIEFELDLYVPSMVISTISMSSMGRESPILMQTLIRRLRGTQETERTVILERFVSFLRFLLEKMDQVNKPPTLKGVGADCISGFSN